MLKTVDELKEAMEEGDVEGVEYLASFLSRKEVSTNIGIDNKLRDYLAALRLFVPYVEEKKSKEQIRKQHLRFNTKFKDS